MVRTHGLSHISLAVRDAERSLRFYREVFGVEVVWRGRGRIEVQTPGARDFIDFDETARKIGRGGVAHFGFRLKSPKDIDRAVRDVERAGAQNVRHGKFQAGEPYLFFEDPDGYEIEIWYEPQRRTRTKPAKGPRRRRSGVGER